MILKLQHVSVFFIKPSSGSRFAPNKVAFSLYLFLKYVGSMSGNKSSRDVIYKLTVLSNVILYIIIHS